MNAFTSCFFKKDILAFAHERLGFFPDPVQTAILKANPKRCLLNCTRQWGKSTITAIKALHNAMFLEGSLTLVLSPSERQSAEFLNKVRDLLLKTGIKPRGDGKNPSSLLLTNKSRIIGLPSVESTVRGFSAVSLLLIDEASRVSDELYQTVSPMMAVSDGAVWLISTPNGRRGFFFREWDSNDPQWTRVSVPASECPRISNAFLERERKSLGERFFLQEYCCQFHDEGGQLISGQAIDRSLSDTIQPLPIDTPLPLVQRKPQPETPPASSRWPDHCERTKFYMGIDFGKHSDYTAIAILEKSCWSVGEPNHWNYERQQEFRIAVRYLERFPLDTPYLEITARIGRLVRSFHPKADLCLIADATGIGDLAVEFLRSLYLNRQVFPVMITSGQLESMNGIYYHVPKRDLIMKLAVQFDEGSFKISSQLALAQTLRAELNSLGHKFSSSGHDLIDTWRRDQHDDLVFAVALANWCARRDRWKNENRSSL